MSKKWNKKGKLRNNYRDMTETALNQKGGRGTISWVPAALRPLVFRET